MDIEVVTVFHNNTNEQQHHQLVADLAEHDPAVKVVPVDNRTVNRGFGRGCNYGAFELAHGAPIIGFINPDARVTGPVSHPVERALTTRPRVVITGCRFGKPGRELKIWGVNDWVCGAAMFVARAWFESVGGFDPAYVWGWEETDLIRQAESSGHRCVSIDLPISHASPNQDTPHDAAYKRYHFKRGSDIYYARWGR